LLDSHNNKSFIERHGMFENKNYKRGLLKFCNHLYEHQSLS